jgi:hypothetical protein
MAYNITKCLTKFLIPQLTPEMMNAVKATLCNAFGYHINWHGFPSSWLAHSSDCNPLDFGLWGYLKSRVYYPKPQTIAQLRDNIHWEITIINANMLCNVIQNFAH